MPYLTLRTTAGEILKQWEFRGRTVIVGRGEKVDVIIDDAEMSRSHFTITPDGETYALTDGSSNGTLLNGKVVKGSVPLKNGDLIAAGTSRFVFEDALETVIRKMEKGGPSYSAFIRELSQPKPTPAKPRSA